MRISKLGETDGFLTGYYEPIIDGSRVPTGEFTAPLYRRPPNLVISGWRKLGDSFPSKGVKVGRRVGRRKIVPYYDRGQIENGALDGWHLEICWLRSEIDVLFAQIQGSARIRLEDGSILRVNYDSYNGWPYTPVGRVLIDRDLITKDEMSMQRIREWMEANPDQAKEVRRQNKSYVFFSITSLATEDEAVGAQGVPLLPGRSIAVDHSLHAYGTPFFIAADLPIASDKGGTKFRRSVFAQDTGSAIVGPARADIYFGAGAEAARIAGRIKNSGQFVMLLPRDARSGRGRAQYAIAAGTPGARASSRNLAFGNHGRSDRRRRAAAGTQTRGGAAAGRQLKFEIERTASAMSRRRRLSDEERVLWTGYSRSITPLDPARRTGGSRRTRCRRRQAGACSRRCAAPVRRQKPPEKSAPPLAPLGRRLKQRVARGREPIEARLDLHGYTQMQAHAALLRFLHRAQADGVKMALVVTGKGTGKAGSAQRARCAQAPSAAVAGAAGVPFARCRL